MQETRRARLESVIREQISLLVTRELKDPRIPSITFTNVEVTQDGGHATLYFTLLGALRPDEANPESQEYKNTVKECLAGLNSAKGFLRRNLAKELTVRTVPELSFKEDKGLTNATRVYDLLKQISSEAKSGDES